MRTQTPVGYPVLPVATVSAHGESPGPERVRTKDGVGSGDDEYALVVMMVMVVAVIGHGGGGGSWWGEGSVENCPIKGT